MTSIFNAVQISEASPGWQDYSNFNNEIIFNGFKQSTLSSLYNMYKALTDPEVDLNRYFIYSFFI